MNAPIDIYAVVKRLTGPIVPVADASEDRNRLENLRAIGDVVCRLVEEIAGIAEYSDDYRHSVKLAVETASGIMDELLEYAKEGE